MSLKNTKAFTLVELLVVIGIILVLASIAVPAMFKAREQANRTVCLSNVRGIGQGMAVYANENEDKFPVTATASGGEDAEIVFGRIYNNKNFNNLSVFVCPNRKRSIPPTYDSATGALLTSGKPTLIGASIISYAAVLSCDGAAGTTAVTPLSTDPGDNVLVIEDPTASGLSGGEEEYDAGDNHGIEGTNVYCINGKGKWFKGAKGTNDQTKLPINRKANTESFATQQVDKTYICYPKNAK